MIKKGLIFCCFACFIWGCTGNTIFEKPKDLIPKDSMVLLLKDLFLASSAKNITNINQQRRVSYGPIVYLKYGIDSVRFQNSNFYYTTRLDVYEKMLQDVLAQTRKQQKTYATIKKKRDSIIQDSIRKAILRSKKTDSIKIEEE